MSNKTFFKKEVLTVYESELTMNVYRHRDPWGSIWFSGEVELGRNDTVVLDAKDLLTLKHMARNILPVSIYARDLSEPFQAGDEHACDVPEAEAIRSQVMQH